MHKYHYKHLVCGGTFDHLHEGHKRFLDMAFLMAEKVSIGLTNYPSYQKINPGAIQPYQQRQNNLIAFLSAKNYLTSSHITPIYDLYGPSIHNIGFDSILITNNTKLGAQKVNYKRQSLGLKPLNVINCDLVPGLSSSLIRQGNFSQKGVSFLKDYFLPAKNRKHFQKPMGKLIHSPNSLSWPLVHAKKIIKKTNPPFIAVVGDIAVHSFVQSKVSFNLTILDFKSQRQPIISSLHRKIIKNASFLSTVTNHPSTISQELISHSQNALSKKGLRIIKVRGEEDLAVLPLIILAPLNSLIFYGQPHQGLVAIKVTIAKKMESIKLLKYFD